METSHSGITNISDDLYGFSPATSPAKSGPRELPEPDINILTRDAVRIPAHSSILVRYSTTPLPHISIPFLFFGSDISIRFKNLIIFLPISEFSGLGVAGTGKHNRSATKAPQLRKSHSDPRSPKRRRPRLHPLHLFLKVGRRLAVSRFAN